MMPWDNVAMFVMTMVGIGGKGPPYAGDKSSEPSNKGQPNGSNHSTRACKWRPRGPSNPKKARAGVGLVGSGGKPPRQPAPTMITSIGGP